MAKITIMGDVLQIKSILTIDEIERVKMYAPDALKLFDEEGNEVFGVSIGDSFWSKYGICFCSTDGEGKVFMSTNNPVTDHTDAEAEKAEVIKVFAPVLNKLNAIEAHIKGVQEEITALEVDAANSVTFAQ